MRAVVALMAVLACTAGSVLLIRYVYGLETHHRAGRVRLALMTAWFLVTYAITALVIVVR